MKKKERNGWFYVALISLIISILSLFTPILVYTRGMEPPSLWQLLVNRSWSRPSDAFFGTYTIVDLLEGKRFVQEVLLDYRGNVFWRIDTLDVVVMALLALVSLTASLVGISTMRSQYHRRWQFIMTLAGLAGTAFPSLAVFFAVNQSQKGFDGVIQCGIAPVIMPLAAMISIIAVVYRRSTVKREIQQRAKAENLIWTAGDLTRSQRR